MNFYLNSRRLPRRMKSFPAMNSTPAPRNDVREGDPRNDQME